jgi:microsomal epoxide hydrolase
MPRQSMMKIFVIFGVCFAGVSFSHDLLQHNFIDSNGIKIHVIEIIPKDLCDDRPSLVFVPGLSMPAWIFEKQLHHFSKKFHVVALDPRSQGESDLATEGHYAQARAQDIKAVVDSIHLKSFVLIGWSLGVSEVVSYLDQFGSTRVTGAVLIDGGVGYDKTSDMYAKMTEYFFEFQKNRKQKTFEFVKSIFLQPQELQYLEKLTNESLRTPTNTFMTLFYNMMTLDLRPALSKIQVPTLVVTFNAPWLEETKDIQRRIPKCELKVIENAGHAVFVDQPEQFNAALEEFFEKIL